MPSRTPSPQLAGYRRYSYCEQTQESLYLGEPDEAQLMAEGRFQEFVYLGFTNAALDARASGRKCASTLSTTTCASGSRQLSPRPEVRLGAATVASTCTEAAMDLIGVSAAAAQGLDCDGASDSDANDDLARSSGAPRPGSSEIRRFSAPATMTSGAFHLKYPAMEEAHVKGECRPCAYFLYKVDGCRRGEQCSFCHLCSEGERKKRRKARLRHLGALKASIRSQKPTDASPLLPCAMVG
jgi:hypothetical protein